MVTFPTSDLAFFITAEYILVHFSDFYSEFRTGEIHLSECFGNFSAWLPFFCMKINGIRRPSFLSWVFVCVCDFSLWWWLY